MTSNTKGAIVVIATLGVMGLAYYFYTRTRKATEPSSDSDLNNFDAVKKNLGGKFDNSDIAVVKFNDGKNKAQFYKNNRIFIFDDKDNIIGRGNYSNGGKSISLEKGKQVNGESVWANLVLLTTK